MLRLSAVDEYIHEHYTVIALLQRPKNFCILCDLTLHLDLDNFYAISSSRKCNVV